MALVSRGLASGAVEVAGGAVAAAPGGVSQGLPRRPRRPADEVATPQGVPRSEHRPVAARGRRPPPARDSRAREDPRRRHRAAPLGARQSAGAGGRARLVPCRRHPGGDRGRGGRRAHALRLGRRGLHRGSDRRARHQDFVDGRYRFETLPGVGHSSNEEAPEAINRLLLAHLARRLQRQAVDAHTISVRRCSVAGIRPSARAYKLGTVPSRASCSPVALRRRRGAAAASAGAEVTGGRDGAARPRAGSKEVAKGLPDES